MAWPGLDITKISRFPVLWVTKLNQTKSNFTNLDQPKPMYRVIFDWSSLKQAMFQAYKYNLRKKVMDLNRFREVQYKNHPVDCTRPN